MTVYCNIKVDDQLCEHCYTCVEHCPTDALSIGKGCLEHDQSKCSYDEVCQDVCPNQALKVIL